MSEPGSDDERPTWRERLDHLLLRLQFSVYSTVVVLLLALGFLWPRMFVTVPTGHHGVMYRFFSGGTVTDRVWSEGLHIIPPWDQMTLYETRLQQQTLGFDALSDEGLTLTIEVSVRYRPDTTTLGFLHQDIGPDYFERMIRPDIESHARRTFGGRPAHEIYSSASDLVQELRRVAILARLDDAGNQDAVPYVHVQEIKLVKVGLPAIVESAIAERYRQEQLMLEYRYKLEREDQEAERKRTEASGVRDYYRIIAELTPEELSWQDLLRWRDVDAASALAQSPNSKVVVLGGGGDSGMMFNLGDVGAPAAAPPATAAAAAAAAPAPSPAKARTKTDEPAAGPTGSPEPAASHGARDLAEPAAP
ncbi:prohibitin family protein [Nannocystis radixulma]|uniref:Prohibitin family protein n=1 Tax=Nannocystis radixulma TaxID=2995305 RepID=A0ABT5BG67_9BACT|nr:prohibitin family protein [Nannocystis radixulma]MDC0671976.1 prohibitin family protein [Nannocystis radixulma]